MPEACVFVSNDFPEGPRVPVCNLIVVLLVIPPQAQPRIRLRQGLQKVQLPGDRERPLILILCTLSAYAFFELVLILDMFCNLIFRHPLQHHHRLHWRLPRIRQSLLYLAQQNLQQIR